MHVESDEHGHWICDHRGDNLSDPYQTLEEATAALADLAEDALRERRYLTHAFGSTEM